jgi:hypothetical protein
MEYKSLLRLLANSFYLPEGGMNLRFASEIPVEGDSEAVSFVSYMLKDFKSLRITVYEKRIRISDANNLLQPFGKSDNSQFLGQS